MWNIEEEAKKILKKEQGQTRTWIRHKDGSAPTARIITGYARESVQQGDYFQWAVNSYNKDMAGFLFHIPNESNEGEVVGAIKKGMGVVAGAPDMCYAGAGVEFCEIKRPGEWLNEAQERLHPMWHNKSNIRIPIIFTFAEWRIWIESECLKIIKPPYIFTYYDSRK